MAKKKLTINQQLWKKEMKRIERFQKSASKRGYYFPDEIIPQQPKRITKQALKNLANLTPEKQYAKAVYLDTDTGKMIPALEGRKKERSKASKKGWQARKYKPSPRPKPIIDSGSDGRKPMPNGGNEPLLVDSLIMAMDRALENLYFDSEKVEREVELETKLLRGTWNSTKARFKDHKPILEDYLAKHQSEFGDCLDRIHFPSDSKKVKNAMYRLIELLNYNIPLSTDTLKEFESEYTDIDLTDVDLPYDVD